MNTSSVLLMTRLHLLLPALVLAASSVSSAAFASASSELSYRVWLNQKPIGHHRVNINSSPTGDLLVTTRVSYDVRVLRIPVFTYEHTNREVWDGSCLSEISSETRSNGDVQRLEGKLSDESFQLVVTDDGDTRDASLDGCVGSYAYWDIARLKRTQLLNSQNGELEKTDLTSLGLQQLPRVEPSAQAYRLDTGETELLLWYAQDEEWLALQMELNGRTLTYLNERLVAEP